MYSLQPLNMFESVKTKNDPKKMLYGDVVELFYPK
jgi:hypothetical protein